MKLYRGTPASYPVKRLPAWLLERQPVEAMGRWFTDDLEVAMWYVNDAPDGCLVAVDVPSDVAEAAHLPNQPSSVQRYSLDSEKEYFLPREWADRAVPI